MSEYDLAKGQFSTARHAMKYFAFFILGAASAACIAGGEKDVVAEQKMVVADEVLTAAQAGRIFLSNAGNFIDKNAETSNALAGRTVTADFANGNFRVVHKFQADSQTLSWEVLSGVEKGNKGVVPYQAFDIRPGIIFVMVQPQDSESVALIIDDNRGMAAGFLGRYSPEHIGKKVVMMPIQGPILEAEIEPEPFADATDLAGTRFTVAYPGGVEIYEHIYLNEHYVTWLCHKGTSKGVANTERYEAFKVAPGLHLVAWNEESAPLQISMLFDFETKRERAAIFGFDENRGRTVYQTTSADIPKVTHTSMEGLR